jgi:hypothetical protein
MLAHKCQCLGQEEDFGSSTSPAVGVSVAIFGRLADRLGLECKERGKGDIKLEEKEWWMI